MPAMVVTPMQGVVSRGFNGVAIEVWFCAALSRIVAANFENILVPSQVLDASDYLSLSRRYLVYGQHRPSVQLACPPDRLFCFASFNRHFLT